MTCWWAGLVEGWGGCWDGRVRGASVGAACWPTTACWCAPRREGLLAGVTTMAWRAAERARLFWRGRAALRARAQGPRMPPPPPPQDALGDAVLRKDDSREVDGQLYYGAPRAGGGEQSCRHPVPAVPGSPCCRRSLHDLRLPAHGALHPLHPACPPVAADVEFASPDVHYLSSITVNAGKVYAMFVKSPEKVRPHCWGPGLGPRRCAVPAGAQGWCPADVWLAGVRQLGVCSPRRPRT